MIHQTANLPSANKPNSSGPLPNFLYIGTSKAGSTWLYHVLARHPDVFMAPSKGTYYFDAHFENGERWFRDHFRRATDERVIGEISHSYLTSRPAAERIKQLIPDAKLMVCLRNPIDRAFSAYLDAVKNGRCHVSFSEALRQNDSLLDRGAYATHLANYFDLFQRDQIHVALFDDLQDDPQGYWDGVCSFLDIRSRDLSSSMRQKMMPSARPRSVVVAQLAKRIARSCEQLGLYEIRGRAKRSRWLRHMLYRPYDTAERPSITDQVRCKLESHFRSEVKRLDELVGLRVTKRWNYA